MTPRLTLMLLLGFHLKFKSQIICNYLIRIRTSLIMVSKNFKVVMAACIVNKNNCSYTSFGRLLHNSS